MTHNNLAVGEAFTTKPFSGFAASCFNTEVIGIFSGFYSLKRRQ
jgi:hypothetical protein